MLKNKDGTDYRLNKPNKLSIGQDFWDEEKDNLIFHNFNWGDIVLNKSIELPLEENVILKKEEQPKARIVVIHCLPVVIKNKKDELYGENYNTIEYGNKFTFEGIIVQKEDLAVQIWTTVNKIIINSIIYPSRYSDGIKYGEYRWWKIADIKPDSGGFLIDAIPSGYQPDFSDD